MRYSFVISTVVACAAAWMGACSSDSHGHDQENPDLAEVVYVGATSDEALERMLAVSPKDVESERLIIDSPAAQANLSKAEPALFAFHSATGAWGPRQRDFGLAYVQPTLGRRVLADLKGLLGPERSCFAHGTPFNGTAFYLAVSDATGRSQLRVFTDQTSYAVPTETWNTLAASPQPLKLEITSAVFEENDVVSDGGPFVGASVEFRIQ